MARAKRLYELKIIREKSEIYLPSLQFRNSADIYHAFNEYFAKEYREKFIILPLNAKNKLIGFHTVSIGSATSTLVHPREVFTTVCECSAASIILLHNHPTGDPVPSAEDLAITRRLREIGEVMGVRVLDHVIIGCNRVMGSVPFF